MEKDYNKRCREFVATYFKLYSERNLAVMDFIDDDFIGLDGISTKIYNKEKWSQALKHDFTEIEKPFAIKLANIDVQKIEKNIITVAVISSWYIAFFENFPEFDKMRTVFVLRIKEDSYSIVHLSNSISLLSLDQRDVFPTKLFNLLKKWKNPDYILGGFNDKSKK